MSVVWMADVMMQFLTVVIGIAMLATLLRILVILLQLYRPGPRLSNRVARASSWRRLEWALALMHRRARQHHELELATSIEELLDEVTQCEGESLPVSRDRAFALAVRLDLATRNGSRSRSRNRASASAVL